MKAVAHLLLDSSPLSYCSLDLSPPSLPPSIHDNHMVDKIAVVAN